MNKRTRRIIQEINNSVPKELRERLFQRVFVAPDLRLSVREAASAMREEAEKMEESVQRRKLVKEADRLQNMIDAGYYDTTELRVDQEVAKQIDAWVSQELDKAIAEGRIPHPKHDRQYQSFIRKLKQNGKRKQQGEGDQEPVIG
jgi:hypothetical protein